MATITKRKTSLTLNSETLDAASSSGVNISAVADKALEQSVTEARQQKWLEENATAFSAQAAWHEENHHPLADIMMGPASAVWQ